MSELARIRKSKAITQVELAEKVGVTQGCISQIEKGDISGKIQTLAKIANVLGVKLDDLYSAH